jgi:hypothetical protein
VLRGISARWYPCPACADPETWWVYYLDDSGHWHYVTGIPMTKGRAYKMARAAQKHYGGRCVVQLTKTPPNDQAHARREEPRT